MNTPTPVILVADDEAHILRIVSLKLSRAGFSVVSAYDGRTAWDQLQNQFVDLVISDYQMPEMNGIELAQRMHEDERLASIPVILLTAKSFNLAREDMADTNIVALVSKPFGPTELLEAAKNILRAVNVEAG